MVILRHTELILTYLKFLKSTQYPELVKIKVSFPIKVYIYVMMFYNTKATSFENTEVYIEFNLIFKYCTAWYKSNQICITICNRCQNTKVLITLVVFFTDKFAHDELLSQYLTTSKHSTRLQVWHCRWLTAAIVFCVSYC